jgi:hypothetical protein
MRHVSGSRILLVFMIVMADWNSIDSSQLLAEGPQAPATSPKLSQDRDLLRRSTHSVWFDAEASDVKPPSGRQQLDVSDRNESIATTAPPNASPWWDGFWQVFSDFFSWIFQGWSILLILFALLAVGLAVFAVLRYGVRGTVYHRSRQEYQLALEREKAKIRDLPFEIEQTSVGLLGQAEKYRAAGELSKAINYLFSHVLVELDGAHCIRLERGKTNRVYLRELRNRETLGAFTKQLVFAFEYAFFGKHQLSPESFEAIWSQLTTFEDELKQLHDVPASGTFSQAVRMNS